MFWVQAGISFAFWLALGIWQARRGPELYGKAATLARPVRITSALGALALALAILFLPLGLMLKYKAFGSSVMSLPTWLGVSIVGLLFVALQSFATALLATLARDAAVTQRVAATSSSQDRSL